MKDLLKQIEKYKEYLCNKLNEENKEKVFFDEFNSKLSLSIIDNFLNINLVDFIKAFLTSSLKDTSYEDITAVINEIKPFFESEIKRTHFLKVFTNIMVCIIGELCHDELPNLVNNNDDDKLNADDEQMISKIKKSLSKEKSSLDKFIRLCYYNPKIVGTILALCSAINKAKDIHQQFEKAKLNDMPNEARTILTKMEKDIFEFEFNIKNIEEVIKDIQRYSNGVILEEKNKKKRIKKKRIKKNLMIYTYVENWIKRIKKGQEIVAIPNEIMRLEDEKLKKQILKNIYNNNMSIYANIEEKYNVLSSNSYNKYSLLLEQYGIDISKYDIDITNDINVIAKILKITESLNITNPQNLVEIINNSKLEIVENINNLVKKGYIDNEYVSKNINIFNDNYINLTSNIKEFKKEGLSLSSINNLKNSLCEDTNKIQRNIEILKEYKLFSSLGICTSSDFLSNDQLAQKIDKILELGMEKFLKNDLSLLNYDNKEYKRVLLMNKLNIPIPTLDNLHNILLSSSFVVSDDKIDNYLFNVNREKLNNLQDISINKSNLLELLKEKQSSVNVYSFDGVIISKNKVLRNLENSTNEISLKDTILSIIDGKVLDNNELEKITKSIYPKEKQYKK